MATLSALSIAARKSSRKGMSANWSGAHARPVDAAGCGLSRAGADQLALGGDEIKRIVVRLHHDAGVRRRPAANARWSRSASPRSLARARGKCRVRDRRSPRPCRCARPRRVTATQPTTQKSSFGMSSKPTGSPCCRKPCAVAAVSKSTPFGRELVRDRCADRESPWSDRAPARTAACRHRARAGAPGFAADRDCI